MAIHFVQCPRVSFKDSTAWLFGGCMTLHWMPHTHTHAYATFLYIQHCVPDVLDVLNVAIGQLSRTGRRALLFPSVAKASCKIRHFFHSPHSRTPFRQGPVSCDAYATSSVKCSSYNLSVKILRRLWRVQCNGVRQIDPMTR